MCWRIAIALPLVILGSGAVPAVGQTPDSIVRALVGRAIVRLKSDNLEERELGIRTLQCLGPAARPAIPDLVRIVKDDPIGEMRFAAIRTLGPLVPDARVALPAIRGALKDEDHLVRVFAAEALVRLDPSALEVAVAVLAEVLRYSRRERAEVPPMYVFHVLGGLGPRGRGAEAAVVEYIREGSLADRPYALDVLLAMGADGDALVPLLIGVLKDRNYPEYFELVGRGTSYFLAPVVTGRFPSDGNEGNLLRFEGKSVLELGQLCRQQAAHLLGRIGPRALAAVPALREVLDDPHPEVRRVARTAVEQIERRP